jgi:hypothetical protein
VNVVPKEIVNDHDTCSYEHPKQLYTCTTIQKELQYIRFNDEQIFHTAIMTFHRPETDISGFDVTYDPNAPLYDEKFEFAKGTKANLACFVHHG